MPQLKENAFTFESKGLPRDTFSVVNFTGEEGLSSLYRFEIQLISERQDLDLAAVLQHPATFTIKGRFANGPELPFHGILSGFEQMHRFGPYTFYRTELRPKLWWLTLTHHNQVFLDKKIDPFRSAVLKDGGLAPGVDFEFRLQGKYDPREYVCQYGESHFDFVSRWLEREGAYYWFEQGETSEKMIAADTVMVHAPLPGHETFLYSPMSGLDGGDVDKTIKRFTLKQSPLPRNVLLRDYNYMKPSLELEGKAHVHNQGRGQIYLYGEHFPDKNEGQRLAKVRAEEFLCREKIFNAQSSIPAVRPGYLFNLQRHYSPEFNRQYLTTSVHHEGSQARYLVSGLGLGDLEDKDGLFYRNTFACIPGGTQFRPPRTTPKPRISGSLSAKIDAAGSGQYAELDEHGRYKVILPFDLSGRKDGKASAWVRMMQPYAGEDMGFHAPLHKGTEVLLSFIEADPDRPVISGAIPNAETPSPVRDENQTQVRLVSSSGNVMHMEDQEGKQRILMHSPQTGSFIRMGYKNDPDDDPDKNDEEDDHTKDVDDPRGDCIKDNTHGIKVKSEKTMTFESGDSCTIVHGNEYSHIIGDEQSWVEGDYSHKVTGTAFEVVGWNAFECSYGLSEEFSFGGKLEVSVAASAALEIGEKAEVGLGHKFTFHEIEEKWHAEKNTLEGVKNELVGEINALITDRNLIVGYITTMQGATSQLAGNVNKMAGAVQKISGQVSSIAGEQSAAFGQTTKAVGMELKLIESQTKCTGMAMQISHDILELAGMKETI
jgi:type VI secretion system secreted protein VgrG